MTPIELDLLNTVFSLSLKFFFGGFVLGALYGIAMRFIGRIAS